MKKLLIIAAVLFSIIGRAQEAKPVAATLKQVQSPQFWYNTADSSVWVYKGVPYAWTQLQRVAKKYSIWNHTSITNSGWSTGMVLGFNSSGNLIPLSPGAASMVYPGAGLAKSTGSAWATSVTDNSANWNTAYGWGNHAGLYAPIAHVGATGTAHGNATASVAGFMTAADFTKLGGIATSADRYLRWYLRTSHGYTGIFSSDYLDFVAGSGITIDDNLTAGSRTITFNSTASGMVYPGAGLAKSTGSAWTTSVTDNSANWNTAYGWGNHAGLYTPIAHKTTEDALNGLVKVNGAGTYSAVTDNSTNWNSAYTNMGKGAVDGGTGYYNFSSGYFVESGGFIIPFYRATISAGDPLAPTGGTIYTALTAKQDNLTLTTIGTSGAATFDGINLNIPQYSGGTNYWSTDAYGIYRSSPVGINGTNTIGYDQTVHGRANFLYTGGATAYAISSESNGTLANFYALNTGANGAGLFCNATGTGSFGGILQGQRSDIKVSMDDTAPASATATGQAGEIRVTAGYIYVCTATNTWVRAALSTW